MKATWFADKRAWLGTAAVALGVAGLILFRPDELARFPSLCPHKLLTGGDCPGCGMLRALSALAHGDWHAAVDYNLAVVVVAPILLFEAVRHLGRRLRQKS